MLQLRSCYRTLRWQKEIKGDTSLEAIIFEGLADHFAKEATGRNNPSPWSYALTLELKKIFIKKASQEWLQPSYDNNLWFFGSSPSTVPRWAGYTLGYDLVGAYLKANPGTSASSLVHADAVLFANDTMYN